MTMDSLDHDLEGLPPELAELDAELSEISLDERPSFGPELRNELARAWAKPAPRRSYGWVRQGMAAAVATVAFAGLAVPPARASLVEGVQRIILNLRTETEDQVTLEEVLFQEETTASRQAAGVEAASPAPLPPPLQEEDEAAVRLPPFRPGNSAYPRLLDPAAEQALVLEYYPDALQEAGIGGTVKLQLWVRPDGSVDHVQVARGSEFRELDRAALLAAPALRFEPAMRNGVPVGTWVEFDLVFEPSPLLGLQEPEILETPMVPAAADWEPPRSWSDAALVPAPILMEAQELLRGALGPAASALEARAGSLDAVLAGDVPAGMNPARWREDVIEALQGARTRDPENPAPYLALARIRRKQGLRNEAQLLFDEGLARATGGDRPVSPRLVAELSYEQGRITRENWLAWRGLGQVEAAALAPALCPGMPADAGALASPETLLGWNYSCSSALEEALDGAFQVRDRGSDLRAQMTASFVAAVEAYPAHVGANTEILLDLADREAWHPVLEGAGNFAWASQGHPNALLLEGLALHRLGRTEDASESFEEALTHLAPESARAFHSLELLYPAGAGSSVPEWAALDPILSTPVNERQLEHWARAAYALLRFGSLEADAARVWVRYGRPLATRAFAAGAGLRLELWDYGDGPDVTFYRPASSQNGALTPEGEEYLSDLVAAFPHWYGSRARPLYALPAQVARFQGSRDGSAEFAVHFRVPEEFRQGAAGDLEVAAFQIGPNGMPRETSRWSVDPGETRVDLQIPAGPGVSQVVVELFHAGAEMAAGIRIPVERQDPVVSDLLVTEPAQPARIDLGHMGQGLDPVPVPGQLTGPQAGVFLEVYGMGLDETYQLRVTARVPGTAESVRVPFRPAGQELFGLEWTRRPVDERVSPEFLLLDLTGLEPGSYDLEVTVIPEGGAPHHSRLDGLRRGHGEPPPGALSLPPKML